MTRPIPKLLITLDYELFFGQSGTVEHCLIKPIDALLSVLNKYNAKMVLFVDVGYLVRLEQLACEYPALQKDHDTVVDQLRGLSMAGHDIQLHIHPHWEDTTFSSSGWQFNTDRYRLHNFDSESIESIVRRYTDKLRSISHLPVFAYRAGGWCLQPFEPLRSAFSNNGIWLDSTVFASGRSTNENREFDFSNAPQNKKHWRFSADPVIEDPLGDFVQVPISSVRVSPLFYWKMALMKFFPDPSLNQFGNGAALANSSEYYLDRLTRFSTAPASIDGAKASLLESGLKRAQQIHLDCIYNVMGHPKALSPYSINKLDRFLQKHSEIESITFQDLVSLNPQPHG